MVSASVSALYRRPTDMRKSPYRFKVSDGIFGALSTKTERSSISSFRSAKTLALPNDSSSYCSNHRGKRQLS